MKRGRLFVCAVPKVIYVLQILEAIHLRHHHRKLKNNRLKNRWIDGYMYRRMHTYICMYVRTHTLAYMHAYMHVEDKS